MSAQLGPPLIGLFAPRPPVRYLPPADVAPEKRNTPKITGVAEYLSLFDTHDNDYKGTETFEEAKHRRRTEKKEKHAESIKKGLDDYNPNEDTQVRGDPYKTLFVSRLSYEVTEDDLQREFGRYGPMERIRIVRNEKTDKPRGYAFLVFEREKDMKAAYKDADGIRIKDRRILVDVERGRTVKSWKPMRLGGGLGGRQKPGKSLAKDGYSSTYSAAPPRSYDRGPPRPTSNYSSNNTRDVRDDRGSRDRSRSRPDRSDRNDRGYSQGPRSYDAPPPVADRHADRQRQGRQGIGFDRPPDARAPPRAYHDTHIEFQSQSQPALDPRARQPPTSYAATPPISAPSAPWLSNSGSSGAAKHSSRDRPTYEDDRDRDYKRRRY